MHPALPARNKPDAPAIIMGSGKVLSFSALDKRSNQIAHLLLDRNLKRGDSIALLVGNCSEFIEICSAALRIGLYFTPIATGLTAGEAQYIVNDCGARVLFADAKFAETAKGIQKRLPDLEGYYSIDGSIAGFDELEASLRKYPTNVVADESLGSHLLYSSGTTGRPKGIKTPLPVGPIDADDREAETYFELFGIDSEAVYLSPAPMYHAAPLRFALSIMSLGATVVIMEKFDPEQALELIEQHRITHSQWVPTMFVKMLKLSDEEKSKYDLSSHKMAIHGAAPCPPDAKRRMIEWWGPILYEYYGGSEGIGSCAITSEEWLAHPGSVGTPKIGQVHIFDDGGNELGAGETGFVYFSGGPEFEYLHQEEATAAAKGKNGARTFGDVGHVDAEGYLYLTDRASNLIISGGVNVYPQETENILISHPSVADAAVFGVPNSDFGEEVKAVVQPIGVNLQNDAFAAELMEYCRGKLAAVKCPRSIDFESELPREDNGKLYKRLLRDRYWQEKESKLL